MANREKVIKDCNWAVNQITVNGFTTLMSKGFFKDVLSLIKDQPEVIRCKDCKYGDQTISTLGKDMVNCKYHSGRFDYKPHEPDWFCADGKKRTE